MAKFEIKKSTDNQFYFVLKVENNKVVLQSETYHSKQGAKNGIESIKSNVYNATIEDQT